MVKPSKRTEIAAFNMNGSVHLTEPRLGLRPNLGQFSLLVLVNAFVGAMVGLERTILPAIAEQEFHLVARTAVLSRYWLRGPWSVPLYFPGA